MAKGKQKPLRKHFLMQCPACSTQQESLRKTCSKCKEGLHPDLDAEEVDSVVEKVVAMEKALKVASQPDKASPYGPVDEAYKRLKSLDRHAGFPGLDKFLEDVRKQLLPHKIAILKRTFKANVIFLGVLVVFPLLPLLVGWPMIITGLLALPVLAWGGITFKAWRDYQRALAQQT